MAQGKGEGALRAETETDPSHAVRVRPLLTLQILQQGRELRVESTWRYSNITTSAFPITAGVSRFPRRTTGGR